MVNACEAGKECRCVGCGKNCYCGDGYACLDHEPVTYCSANKGDKK